MTNLLHLKSGSDIRGTALGEKAVLTTNVAVLIGMAFAKLLSQKLNIDINQLNIAIGRDSRLTGEKLSLALAEGICLEGANAFIFGMCTTPSMYHCLINEPDKYCASVMVTASHHPFDKNGFKFFVQSGGISSSSITDILEIASTIQNDTNNFGKISYVNYLQKYVDSLKILICKKLNNKHNPLEGLHVVVDAGNGAGGFYTKLLKDLGANTNGSQFIEPDGMFPNHPPNPENNEAMLSISNAVVNNKADIGIIFDADCDRAAIVDSNGSEINRNRLIALISAILLQDNKDLVIVTDSVTSTGLQEFISLHGGKHHRFKRGYRNVIDEAIRLNAEGINAPIAIETSGHCAFRDNNYLDDGMYLATLLLIQSMKIKNNNSSLGKIIEDLKEAKESLEVRLPIVCDDFRQAGALILQNLENYAKAQNNWIIANDNHEGLRIYFEFEQGKAWFMLRLSVHDPVMPVNIESDFIGGTKILKNELSKALQNENCLDISNLK